jgi:hypothetical protein
MVIRPRSWPRRAVASSRRVDAGRVGSEQQHDRCVLGCEVVATAPRLAAAESGGDVFGVAAGDVRHGVMTVFFGPTMLPCSGLGYLGRGVQQCRPGSIADGGGFGVPVHAGGPGKFLQHQSPGHVRLLHEQG